jgi:hypothetical protein
MKPMRSIACVVAGALSALAPACVDLSPVPFDNTSQWDASPPADAATVSDAAIAACGACLTSTCASELAMCTANAECAKFVACMTPAACWGSSLTDLSHLPPCLLNCGKTAGFSSYADPGSIASVPLLECAQDPTKCESVCAPNLADQ